MSPSSVRTRLFIVVTGMALLASMTIGVAYAATEPERLELVVDARSAADLFDLSSQLSSAIRDEESAIDDYLLSRSPTAVARHRAAVEAEIRLTEQIRGKAAAFPEARSALDALGAATAAWRATFANPAITAVDRSSDAAIDRLTAATADDQEGNLTSVAALIAAIRLDQDRINAREDSLSSLRVAAAVAGIGVMLLASVACVVLIRRWVTRPLDRLLSVATRVRSGENVAFEAEGRGEIGVLSRELERMRTTLQHEAERSTVLNRFTEVTTFAADDAAVAAANLEALRLLVEPDAAVTHVLNRSKDRAVPEASIGSATADVLPLHALSQCPGVVRGGIYVTSDASQPLSVRCPVYPVTSGTLACIPLAHGELVGAVHLAWARPAAFPLESRLSVSRIAEHAALAIGNRRLLAALKGMASTDARTGLPNARTLDQTLEEALASRRDPESVALLMLDIDHFKDFNDRYGHPAGDEALRAFADILRSCIREGDLAARYGGEEFAVILPSVDDETAGSIAERIRSRTESTLISLAPGLTDRISVSIGIASAPNESRDRVGLLRLADEALYRAKQNGRNRVETAATSKPAVRRRVARMGRAQAS